MGHKLALFTNSKSHMGFPSVSKLVTLSDLEQLSNHHYTLFNTTWQLLEPTTSNSLQLDPYCQQKIVTQEFLAISEVAELLASHFTQLLPCSKFQDQCLF